MKRILVTFGVLGALWMLPNPEPAQATDRLGKCTISAVKSCESEFQMSNEYMVAIRGWCYMIRTALCLADDGDKEG